MNRAMVSERFVRAQSWWPAIRLADRIVVPAAGRIAEIGRHGELLTRAGRCPAPHAAQAG